MKNIIQDRAIRALEAVEQIPDLKAAAAEGGDALSGFPVLIRQAGLLAALAYARELDKKYKPKRLPLFTLTDCLANHLNALGICSAKDGEELIYELANPGQDGRDYALRRSTMETLQWLGYVKRFAAVFVKPEPSRQEGGTNS